MTTGNRAAAIPIAPSVAPSTSDAANAAPPVVIAPPIAAPQPAPARRPPARAVAGSDIVFVNGLAYNGRGYRVCGVSNQRGTLCGRIGQCPFHAGKQPGPPPENGGPVPKRRRVADAVCTVADALPQAQQPLSGGSVRQMDAPPTKSRFKRSWTPAEHRQFLISMKKYGKGKWKEISREVKTRTANQCQSHAQKYFLRQAKSNSERKKKSIHDLTAADLDEEPRGREPVVHVPGPSQPAPQPQPMLPKVDPLPTPPPVLNSLPSPPPPIQSPSHYFTSNPGPPSFSLQQDNHPGASNVDALASVALATASASAGDAGNGLERSKAITAVVNAALKNADVAQIPALSNATLSEGASSAREQKPEEIILNATTGEVAKAPPPPAGGQDEQEQGDESSDNEAATNEPDATKATGAAMAAAVQFQALAQVAQQLAVSSANNNASNAADSKPNSGNMSSMLSGPFSQLLNNPQALFPLLANISGMGGHPTAAAPVIPATQRLRVTIHVNGRKGGGMALVLPESNEMADFFKQAKSLLSCDGAFQRVFTRSGGEITSLDQMVQDDALWLSLGEEFLSPS